MDAQTNELDIENPENEEIEEILMEIPTLIDKAHRSGINTKQFRDIISSLLKDLNESNEVLELFLNITRDDSEFSFVNQLSEKSEASEEEKWNTDLKEIVKKLQSYPILSSWSSSQLSLLENVVEISNRLVGLVNEDRED